MRQVQEIGFNTFIDEFKIKPKEVLQTLQYNRNRHTIIKFWNGLKIVLITKKFPFLKYGELFDNNKGFGESINLEALSYYLKLGIDFIVIRYLEDKKTYYIRPYYWIENGNFREVDKKDPVKRFGQVELIRERTMCVPMKELTRLKSIKELYVLRKEVTK